MRYIRLFIILIIVFGISVPAANAEDESPSVYESALAGMINDARMSKGLEPLSFHPKLYKSASSHSLDMIEKSYYSSTSPDGKTFQERMLENGYIPVISGESLGMLSFRNFINPDSAINVIFGNLLKNESDSDKQQALRILNPDVKDIGIGFRAGTFERDGVVENVYVVVCDVGNNDTSHLESELISMINNARKKSRKAFEDLGMDMDDVEKSLGYYSWVLDNELSPLTNNEKLREAARNHNQDMIQRFYFDNVSPEGEKPFDRLNIAEYKALYVSETIGAVIFDRSLDPTDAIRFFFASAVENELNSIYDKGIFEREATDIGIGFDILSLNTDKEYPLKIYLITVEIAFDKSIFSGRGGSSESRKFYIFTQKNIVI